MGGNSFTEDREIPIALEIVYKIFDEYTRKYLYGDKSIVIVNEDLTESLINYLKSLIRYVSNKRVIIKTKSKKYITININNRLKEFIKFWTILERPGYTGFSLNDFLEFLTKKREWNLDILYDYGDLFLIDSKEIFYAIELGTKGIKRINLDKLSKIEQVLRDMGKEVMYYVVSNERIPYPYRIFVLY